MIARRGMIVGRVAGTRTRNGRARVFTAIVLALGAAAAVCTQGAPGSAVSTVDVYFLQGEQAVVVPRDGSDAEAAVRRLLGGPTAEEMARGIRSQVPPGVPVRSVTVSRGVATIDLGEKFASGRRADSLSARLAQLVLTVTAAPGVKSARVLVKGGVPLGLFPGVDLTKPATAESIAAPQGPTPVAPPPPTGPPTAPTLEVERKLADLGYLDPAEVDGGRNQATFNAVMAFQKWEGLTRDGVAGPQTSAALATAIRPTPRTKGAAGTRVEVLLDRQLTLSIVDNEVARVLHISSGKPGYETPTGSYRIERKYTKDWSVPYDVWLPWASYFVGGVAFHEYPEIPPVAASHGCVRVPPGDMKWLYDRIPVGTPVTVLGSSQ
jgi:lipoprotein-anchoring transpeptidase ErfK/SrfK